MIAAVLRDDAFLADVAVAEQDPEALFVWWLGQSGFLLAHGPTRVLLDPYLSDSLTARYERTDQPHVRLSERVVAPERLAFVDVIAASHGHTDHLDGETLTAVLAASPHAALVVPEAIRELAADRAGLPRDRPLGSDDGLTVEPHGVTVTGVPAAHETLERDDAGRLLHLGYVVRLGPFAVYHAGDTIPYEGQAERLRGFALDLALLPINGRDPRRGVAGNLDGVEAARLAREAGARLAVPCHYDMFAFNTAPPDAFVTECEQLGQRYRVLRAGERLRLEPV